MNYCWILVVAFALAGLSSVELRPHETIEDQKILEDLFDLEKRLLIESGRSHGNDMEYLEYEDALQGSLKSMINALTEELELIANGNREEAHILAGNIVSAILDAENSIMKIEEQLKRMIMITKLFNDLTPAEASETVKATKAIMELMAGGDDDEEFDVEDGEFDEDKEVKDKKRIITKGETVTEEEVKGEEDTVEEITEEVDVGAS